MGLIILEPPWKPPLLMPSLSRLNSSSGALMSLSVALPAMCGVLCQNIFGELFNILYILLRSQSRLAAITLRDA